MRKALGYIAVAVASVAVLSGASVIGAATHDDLNPRIFPAVQPQHEEVPAWELVDDRDDYTVTPAPEKTIPSPAQNLDTLPVDGMWLVPGADEDPCIRYWVYVDPATGAPTYVEPDNIC